LNGASLTMTMLWNLYLTTFGIIGWRFAVREPWACAIYQRRAFTD